MDIIEWCNANIGFIETIGIISPLFFSFIYFLGKGIFRNTSGKAKNDFISSQTNELERNFKLKKRMEKDLLRKDPCDYDPRKKSWEQPNHAKFISWKWTIIDIEDNSLFKTNKKNSFFPNNTSIVSPIDFYPNGLIVRFNYNMCDDRIDKEGFFFSPKKSLKKVNNFKNISVGNYGYIPFKNIINYERENNILTGGHPILYCKFDGLNKTAYENIEYRKIIKDAKFIYLPKLNKEMKFEDTFWGWIEYRIKKFLRKLNLKYIPKDKK